MNNQSPLIPQGSFLEQKNKGRARVKIAVFVVLAIHGIGLLALLMQGCKKDADLGTGSGAESTNTAIAPAFAPPTNTPPLGTNVSATPSTPTTAVEPLAPVPAPSTPVEYKVLQGDTFSTIAKKFHTSVKAIENANPGVDPTKLQIGQKLHIPLAPAASGPAAGTATTSAPPADLAPGEQIYSVQSGDTLIGIAAKYKVSVKALRSANNLTTDKIKVGQKLKIPAASAPAPGAVPAGTPASGQ